MATTVDEIIVEIKAETAELRKGLDKTNKALKQANNHAKSSAVSFRNLGKVFAAIGIIRLGQGLTNTIRKFEDLGATMRAVTGSVANANKAMSVIEGFTSTTPFQVEDVTSAFIKFYQAGVTPSEEALTAFGNLAAGMGQSIDTIAEATFKATTGEMEMLKQFGITAKQLGDEVEFTFEGQTKTVEKSREAIAGYIRGIGETRFPTALQERLNTLSGSISNLQDKTSLFAKAIGDAGLTPALTQLANTLQETVAAAGDEGLANSLGELLGGAVESISGLIIALNTNFEEVMSTLKALGVVILTVATVNIAATLVGSLIVLKTALLTTVIPAIVAATTAMWGFAAAMAVNPITYIVLALAGLVAAGIAIYNNWEEIRIFFKNLFTVHLPNFVDEALISFNQFKITIIEILNDLLVKAAEKVNELLELYNAIPFLDDKEPVNFNIDISGAKSKIQELKDDIADRTTQLEVFVAKVDDASSKIKPTETGGAGAGTGAGTDAGGEGSITPKKGMDDNAKAAERLKVALGDLKQTVLDNTQAFTNDFVKGLMDGKDALSQFKDFAKSLVSQIISTFLQLAVVNQILNAVFGLKGDAALPTMSGFGGKAGGGKVQKGTPTMVGERGPELFVPDTTGSIRNNADSKGGGQPIIVNQTVSFSTGIVPTVRAEVTKMLPQINDMTKAAVLEAATRGGSYRKGLLGT